MSSSANETLPHLVIRPLTVDDISRFPTDDVDRIAFLQRIVERSDWSHKGVRPFIAELTEDGDATPTLVASAYVGLGYPPYYPQLSADTKQLNLAHLEVFEPFRRRGFALRMLEFFKEEAARLELHVFRAECEKGWHVGLYERAGFTAVPYKGPRDDYPDSHQMLELWFDPLASSS